MVRTALWLLPMLLAGAGRAAPGVVVWNLGLAGGKVGADVASVTGDVRSEVSLVDGQPAGVVTAKFTPRAGRHQLQWIIDQRNLGAQRARYYLLTRQSRNEPEPGLLQLAELFPYSTDGVLKTGGAKVLMNQRGEPDAQGWRQTQVLFEVDRSWDGALLQFRLLFYSDNMETGSQCRTVVRQMDLRRLTDAEAQAQTADLGPADTTPPAPVPAEPEIVPITFRLDRPQAVTLVLEDESGKRVRNLFGGREFAAGQHTVYWDGLVEMPPDLDVQPGHSYHGISRYAMATPGKYTVKILSHDPLDIRYEFAVNTGGDPPWRTADGRGGWFFDHTPPTDCLYLPDKKQVVVCSPLGEGGDGWAWLDATTGRKVAGTRTFGAGGGWCGGEVLARDDGVRARGEVSHFSAVSTNQVVEVWEHGKQGDHKLYSYTYPEKHLDAEPGLTVLNDLAVVSLPREGQLQVLDLQAGALVATVTVPKPQGVAYLPTGELLVLSGRQLLRFPPFGAATATAALSLDRARPVVTAGLDDPHAVRVFGDRVMVSDWGNSHQIKVFDTAGHQLGTFGKPGAPSNGPYDPQHMRHPRGCWVVPPPAPGQAAFAGAPMGQPVLWVAEADQMPKRLSVWSFDGRLLRAFYGPAGYGGGGFIDPVDKTKFFYAGMEFKLDWATGRSDLVNVYGRGVMPGSIPDAPLVTGGHRYLTNLFSNWDPHFCQSFIALYLYTPTGVLKPATLVGTVAGLTVWSSWEPLKSPDLAALVKGKDPRKTFFMWNDLDGDGQPQVSECSVAEAPVEGAHPMTIDSSLTIVTGEGVVLRPKQVTPAGIPIYDLAAPTRLSDHLVKPDLAQLPLLASDGWFVQVGSPITGVHPGSVNWTYPCTHLGVPASQLAPLPQYPGHMIGPTHLAGFTIKPRQGDAGELWTMIGNRGNLMVMTTDGFFVGELFRDRKVVEGSEGPAHALWPATATRGMSVRNMTLGEECFWPSMVQTPDGDVYVVAGHEFCALFRVTGLETVKRWPSQTIAFTPDLLQRADNAQVQRQLVKVAQAGRATLRIRSVQTPMVVDGRTDDWAGAAWVPLFDGGTGALQVSGDRLFMAVRMARVVPATDSFSNAATSDKMLLAGGGGLDLQLGTDAAADQARQLPVAGDLRLLICRVSGKPKAVLYRPVAPGAGAPQIYRSASRGVVVDQIEDVTAAVQLGLVADTFNVCHEASIPLSVLGLHPTPGLRLLGDFGLMRGNGKATTARSYWHNQTTIYLRDLPGEASLTPALWGWFLFE